MDATQRLFSQREAADYLNIDKNTLAKYRRLEYLNTTPLKKTILFSKEDLDNFKEKFLSAKKRHKTKNQEILIMTEETKTTEDKLKDKIRQLETERETKRVELKENFTRETLLEINRLSDEIGDNKIRLEIEEKLREKYWNIYKNDLTPEDFSSLWEGRLREEALLLKLEEIEETKRKLASRYWSGI